MYAPMQIYLRVEARDGFSLMEAIIAMTVVALTGSVLLLGVEATLTSAEDQEEATIGDGLARQMLDEIQGQHWVDPDVRDNPYQISLSASSEELAAVGRTEFDDNDDYNEYTSSPPVDRNGRTMTRYSATGQELPASFQLRTGYMNNWRVTTEVKYVDEDDHSQVSEDPTNYRAVKCRVFRKMPDNTWQLVVQRQRIISYVPTPN